MYTPIINKPIFKIGDIFDGSAFKELYSKNEQCTIPGTERAQIFNILRKRTCFLRTYWEYVLGTDKNNTQIFNEKELSFLLSKNKISYEIH